MALMKPSKIIKLALPAFVAGLALICGNQQVDETIFEPMPGKVKRDIEGAFLREFGKNIDWCHPVEASGFLGSRILFELFKMRQAGFRCCACFNGSYVLTHFYYPDPYAGDIGDMYALTYKRNTELCGPHLGVRLDRVFLFQDGSLSRLSSLELSDIIDVSLDEALIIRKRFEAYKLRYFGRMVKEGETVDDAYRRLEQSIRN